MRGMALSDGLVSDHARAEKMFPGPNRLLLCCWWERRVSRLFGCEHLVQGFVRHLDSVRLHFRNYCNGCIDFLQIKAQQDCFIVEWAESSTRKMERYINHSTPDQHFLAKTQNHREHTMKKI